MSNPHSPHQNYLLDSLPAADLKRIYPYLELFPMPSGESYSGLGGNMHDVYFPTTALVSLRHITDKGVMSEIACVGNEGMIGISLFVDRNIVPCMSFVRSEGYGYRMKARTLIDEFKRAEFMGRLLLRYTHALITQISYTVVCNLQHTIEQRLCRWLLLTLDRMPSNKLRLPQEFVTDMFGIGREVVMRALNKLQQDAAIDYSLGHITVLSRDKLEDQVCECYHAIKNEYDRLKGLDFDWRAMPESLNTWSRASTGICAMM